MPFVNAVFPATIHSESEDSASQSGQRSALQAAHPVSEPALAASRSVCAVQREELCWVVMRRPERKAAGPAPKSLTPRMAARKGVA